MTLRRRSLLQLLSGGPLLAAQNPAKPAIDRKALVQRHNPVVRSFDPLSPLSVGNGQLAFTADPTGLQTFPELYDKAMPLCTLSQWGWHSVPNPEGLTAASLKLEQFDTWGRQVGYPTSSKDQEPLFRWLRENPHRLHLGRFALDLRKKDGSAATPDEIRNPHQTLDLWTGVLESRFEFDGAPVRVLTACHPELDVLAVTVESPLAEAGRLKVKVAFPYGSPEMNAADWSRPEAHRTEHQESGDVLEIRRLVDRDPYAVQFRRHPGSTIRKEGVHEFSIAAEGGARIDFACRFVPRPSTGMLPSAEEVREASRRYWERFWSQGGAVELAGSADPRAQELERRIVLSQYLTAIHSSGMFPPQETGLVCNSWYGKFHLEMHWWHAAHFALWGRIGLLERSLPWYGVILPRARRWAESQGYRGARWPKMTSLDGRDSPSGIGPLLIWQQPHPIYYAELCYRARPNVVTLNRYRNVVFDTAEFMASFAVLDPKRGKYVLGPPVIPAQENHPPRETWNPTYELEYWAWALEAAQRWRERLGLQREPAWEQVRQGLSPLPVSEGVYLAHENCPQTYTARNHDHPSMLGALGVLPGSMVDRETMRRTLKKVMQVWRWPDTWGWDYPMVAMTAARLGEPGIAIDALMMETPKNRYLPNGHNWQRANLPCYLPGNGGLLAAVAMMAAGWDGGFKEHAPGFPKQRWQVRWEGLSLMP